MNTEYVIGVDVGTGSVRAGIFDLSGRMAAVSAKDVRIWRPQEFFVEQSSNDIWSATGEAVRDALRLGRIDSASVIGISFDATCSLVALDRKNNPITISPTANPEQNIIVWMDHRAIREAEEINATKHRVLRSVGGRISPEMEPPKLLWLKRNLPQTWRNAGKFLDLADFMTYRSTGIDVRSLCTTVCKWTYDGEKKAWDGTFFKKLGLDLLLNEGKIGTRVLPMGTHLGNVTKKAARDLGLTTRTKVAVGIIDAHAGGIGVMGMGFSKPLRASQLQTILALIGGTSSCHMAVSEKPLFIPGIWGPYPNAMIPGLWLTEGGQSATGSLVDHVIRNNSAYDSVVQEADKQGQTVYEHLNGVVRDLKSHERKGPEVVKDINILPYFLGNRSPNADPNARGIISGLTLNENVGTVARLYYATIQAIAYGTRHIIEEMNDHGYGIRRIHACGGGTKNPLWLQEHADITGCEIILPKEPEAVLLGTAMLAAVGAGKFSTIQEASVSMGRVGARIKPQRKFKNFHDAKFKVFRRMYTDFKTSQKILEKF
jgi:FGGY-family pentulose kinase